MQDGKGGARMFNIIARRSGKAGLPPGSPVYVGEARQEPVQITLIDYNETDFRVNGQISVEDCGKYRETQTVTWLNIDGLQDATVIDRIGKDFGLHPLVIEDILNTEQRPKLDIFEDHLFLVAKMHTYNHQSKEIEVEQISLVMGRHFVLTFQERSGDIFDPVRKRIKENLGRIRKMGSDYLAYALLDAIVDSYFNVLEFFGEDLEEIEEAVVSEPEAEIMGRIHFLKRELVYLRRSVWPLRELIGSLKREESDLVEHSTTIFLNDLYDHTIQVIDTVETYKDIVAGLIDIYLSSIINRMKEIMKVLTIFAAVFIPLTLIAGIYGMNFNNTVSPLNMPELNWRYGYLFALGLMVIVALLLLYYFKRKKWL
jgi:magnesium transporter